MSAIITTGVNKKRRYRAALSLVTATAAVLGLSSLAADGWQRAVYREAYLPELEAAYRSHPADGPLLSLLGVRLAEAAEYRSAAQVLEQAAGAGVKAPELWLTWAACESADNQPEKAEKILQYAIGSGRCQPSDPAREALARLENLQKAKEADVARGEKITGAEAAHVISPGGPAQAAMTFSKGSVFNALYDWKSRRDPEHSGFEYRRRDALEQPDNPQSQMRWIEALRRNRRLRDAQKAAKTALAALPENPAIITAYADVLYDGGAVATAGVQYRRAVTLQPNYPPAVFGLGKVAVDKKLYQLAVESYEKAAKLRPQDPEAWIGLGRAHYSANHRYDKSLTAFETAGRLAPGRTDFFPYWSDALVANYRVPEGESLLLRRLDAAPEDARTHYVLGKLIYDNRQTPERLAVAEKHLRRSLEIEPGAPVVKTALAKLLLDNADRDQAAEAGALLTDVLDIDPRDESATRLMATAYRKIGRKDRADQTQRIAVKLAEYAEKTRTLEDKERQNPRDRKVHVDLAALYESGGEPEKAKRQREMAYMLKYHREAAERGLTRLSDAVSHATAATAGEVARGRSGQIGATGSVSNSASSVSGNTGRR